MARKDSINSPVVWLFIEGIEEDRHVRSIHATRDSACAELCDLAMRGQQLISPRIERKVISGAEPIRSDQVDQVAAVIKAYRGLASAGKSDMTGRASLRPLREALDALAYPMAVPDPDAPYPVRRPDPDPDGWTEPVPHPGKG